jgi:7-cyano-7-deazaguanine synthase
MGQPGNNCVPIISGGLDSTVLLYLLHCKGVELAPLSINYGQRHRKELSYALDHSERLGLRLEVADLTGITHLIAGSSQTSDDVEVPEGHYAEESMKATVVPNRNMIMLSVAIGYAVSLGFDNVAYGAHDGDHAIYPDCRPVFASAMDTAAMLADWKAVRLLRPFIGSTKAGIVQLGAQLGVPMHRTWSCYKGGELHCGRCGTCVERILAFGEAGVTDLTKYEDRDYYKTINEKQAPAPSRIISPEGSAVEDTPRIIDVEKISAIERELVRRGAIPPMGKPTFRL